MQAFIYGVANKPGVAAIGVWDPFFPHHQRLLTRLSDRAHETNCSSVAVLLYPDPASLICGLERWPLYNSADVRVELLQRAGIDCVVAIKFQEEDLSGTAEQLFSTIHSQVRVVELWLGYNQSLGRGDKGNHFAINRLADRFKVTIVRSPSEQGPRSSHVRQYLSEGSIFRAAELVGYPPIWGRTHPDTLTLAWPLGQYRAFALRDLVDLENQKIASASIISLNFVPDMRHFSSAQWPITDAQYLAFISGPSDRWTAPRPTCVGATSGVR
jgi:hypothetical protein